MQLGRREDRRLLWIAQLCAADPVPRSGRRRSTREAGRSGRTRPPASAWLLPPHSAHRAVYAEQLKRLRAGRCGLPEPSSAAPCGRWRSKSSNCRASPGTSKKRSGSLLWSSAGSRSPASSVSTSGPPQRGVMIGARLRSTRLELGPKPAAAVVCIAFSAAVSAPTPRPPVCAAVSMGGHRRRAAREPAQDGVGGEGAVVEHAAVRLVGGEEEERGNAVDLVGGGHIVGVDVEPASNGGAPSAGGSLFASAAPTSRMSSCAAAQWSHHGAWYITRTSRPASRTWRSKLVATSLCGRDE